MFMKSSIFPVKPRAVRVISQSPSRTSACWIRKCPPFRKVSQDSPPGTNIFVESAVNFCNTMLDRINQDVTPHGSKHLLPTRLGGWYCGFGRNFSRISGSPGLPISDFPSLSHPFRRESIRQSFHDPSDVYCIFFFRPLFFPELFRIGDELCQARVFGAALIWCERLIVDSNQHFCHPLKCSAISLVHEPSAFFL